jgi:hypothetical protein
MSIDEARILTMDKILPCPVKFLDICAFGITCEVTQPNKQLEVGIFMFYVYIHTYMLHTRVFIRMPKILK